MKPNKNEAFKHFLFITNFNSIYNESIKKIDVSKYPGTTLNPNKV